MHIFLQRKWKFCAKLKGKKNQEWAKWTSDFCFTRDCAIYGHSFASLTCDPLIFDRD